MRIGAQMYTVREQCKTLEGFAQALDRIAGIGYRTVQVSGTCPFEAQWLKEQLDRTGLRCVITHTPQQRILNETDRVLRDHHVFGCDYIGLGFWAFDPQRDMSYEKFMETWPAAAKKIRDGGKYFMYHNHDRELIHRDGKPILAWLAEEIPADIMGFTLDTFWIQAGGGDPAWWLEKLAGRIPCIHLKDCAYGQAMAVIGEGNINFERVFQKAEAGGTKYMLVEQDDCHGEDPFQCLERSYRYLKACGFD